MAAAAMVTLTQPELEARAATLSPADIDAIVADDWILHLDGHRLVLVPTTGDWYRYDRVHDTWVPTGTRAGDARFEVVDGHLVARATAPAAAAAPASRSAPRRTGWRSAVRAARLVLFVGGLALSGYGLYSMLTGDDDDPSGGGASSGECAGPEWSLDVPDGWRDVTSGACTAFGHESGGATVGIGVRDRGLDEQLATYDDVLEAQETTVDGRRATRFVRGSGADGDVATYGYLVDLGGRTLELDAVSVPADVSEAVARELDAFAAGLDLA